MSLVKSTGQSWKLFVLVSVLLLNVVTTMLHSYPGMEAVDFAATVIGVGTFGWAFNSLRCPACDLKLLLYAFTSERLVKWVDLFTRREACPRCGYSGVKLPQSES